MIPFLAKVLLAQLFARKLNIATVFLTVLSITVYSYIDL